ncbi:MAG: RNA methyltransferase [bacterium]
MSIKVKQGLGPAPLIILDRPQMGENIGAAARAMLNFGLTGLRLVAPRDGWPNERAGAMAAGATPVIDQARLFDSVSAAISDCEYVLATTARSRDLYLPVFTPTQAASELHARIAQGQKCAILFGAERAGLATDDIAHCQGTISIPVNPSFSSLNLAQAVMVLAWEWAQTAEQMTRPTSPLDHLPMATNQDIEGLLAHLISSLNAVGYFHPDSKRQVMERNLRTIFTRAAYTENEIHVLRGVIKALARERTS